MEKVSMSHEDYLEAIVMLGGTTENPVRSVDIANKLGVSKASVNKAMNALKEKGFADQPYYGDVTLTEDGYRYGAAVLERHELLRKFLTEVGDGIFPRKLMEPRLANVNDEHAARHRPDVDRSIPPAAHYFSPKIGSSSLEYHVSGAGMLPGTMLAVNVESSSRSRPYTVTAFSPFETQPNS